MPRFLVAAWWWAACSAWRPNSRRSIERDHGGSKNSARQNCFRHFFGGRKCRERGERKNIEKWNSTMKQVDWVQKATCHFWWNKVRLPTKTRYWALTSASRTSSPITANWSGYSWGIWLNTRGNESAPMKSVRAVSSFFEHSISFGLIQVFPRSLLAVAQCSDLSHFLRCFAQLFS